MGWTTRGLVRQWAFRRAAQYGFIRGDPAFRATAAVRAAPARWHGQVPGRHPQSMPNMLCSSPDEIAMPWEVFDGGFVNLTVPLQRFNRGYVITTVS